MIKEYKNNKKCSNEKKIERWLEFYALPYKIIAFNTLTSNDLKHILSLTSRGFEEVMISKQYAKNHNIPMEFNFNSITTKEMINIIVNNQDLLKSPIVFDKNNLSVGYNLEKLQRFIPKYGNNTTNRKE